MSYSGPDLDIDEAGDYKLKGNVGIGTFTAGDKDLGFRVELPHARGTAGVDGLALKAEGNAYSGRAKVQMLDDIIRGEAKGPSASGEAKFGLSGVALKGGTNLGSVSGNVGPFVGKAAVLQTETGVKLSDFTAEGKLMGCGVSLGKSTTISILGVEAGIDFGKIFGDDSDD